MRQDSAVVGLRQVGADEPKKLDCNNSGFYFVYSHIR